MPKLLSSYGKIYGVTEQSEFPQLQGNPIVDIEEKTDGSQISFSLRNGELAVCSKRQDINLDNPSSWANGVNKLKEIQDQIDPELIYYGEYFVGKRQNRLNYNRCPEGHIVLFDAKRSDGSFLDAEALRQEALRLGLEPVRTVYSGPMPESLDQKLSEWFESDPLLGGEVIEGFVIKIRSHRDRFGDMVRFKIVGNEFKERRKSKHPSSKISFVDKLSSELMTEARYEKALQAARDDGVNLSAHQKDIGKLVPYILKDLDDEEAERVAQELVKHFWGKIKGSVVSEFVNWYKNTHVNIEPEILNESTV